jgi:hypothetical protein
MRTPGRTKVKASRNGCWPALRASRNPELRRAGRTERAAG